MIKSQKGKTNMVITASARLYLFMYLYIKKNNLKALIVLTLCIKSSA